MFAYRFIDEDKELHNEVFSFSSDEESSSEEDLDSDVDAVIEKGTLRTPFSLMEDKTRKALSRI
jgi:hypothetical protein